MSLMMTTMTDLPPSRSARADRVRCTVMMYVMPPALHIDTLLLLLFRITHLLQRMSNIESFRLALKPDAPLWLSLHTNVSRPQELFPPIRAQSNLAMMDASRIISPSQLVVAANIAVTRDSKQTVSWDVILQAASSSHLGHVLRDNAFGDDSPDVENATIIALAVGGTLADFQATLKAVGLERPQPISPYFNRQHTPEEIANFFKWYKLTSEEVAMSSLEEAILTRVSTKFYV